MKNKKGMSMFAILALTTAFLAMGCTEERVLVAEPKHDVLDKSLITPGYELMSGEYIYVPSVVDSPRSVSATRPHWQGRQKVVRLQWSKHALVVYEIEKDSRFTDNITNQKPIMRIPVTYLDYKCREDSYGECTNAEEQNADITWEKKRYFLPRFEQIDVQELNVLPIALDNLFGNCYAELSSEFVDYNIEKDAINFSIEKTFKNTGKCAAITSLSDVSFNVRYHYSFLKVERAVSKDYQPASYPKSDHGVFGFFETDQITLDPDNNASEESEFHFMNRWNPNRKVTYYLNAPFNKPEHNAVKAATYKAFEAINSALQAANTKLRFELKDPVKGMQPGDLRNNMIVMVEDPQATGIIGYGPTVAYPFTGEIIQGRTVMYLGSIKKYVKRAYDELVKDKLAKLNAEKMIRSKGLNPSKVILADHLLPATGGNSSSKSSHHGDFTEMRTISTSVSALRSGAPTDIFKPDISKETLKDLATNPLNYNELTSDLRQRMEVLSRHNAFPADLIDFHNSLEKSVDDIVEDVGLKPWQNLSDHEKQMVLSKLVPYIWLPTLVHELGHNLGLRHNFAGSEDKDNFYTDKELDEMGTTTPFKYSSVMDYSYRNSNELRVMGKYDIAALRFGYSREVELTNGYFVSWENFKSNSDLEMKPYGYCTDEHVGANPNCNRFDEGTNLLEITKNLIEGYKARSARANFRNGRYDFSLLADYQYMAYVSNAFMNLRMMYERYESIKNEFDLAFDDPVWDEVDFLTELKESMLLTADFFVDVLKMPDIMCAVSLANNPTSIQAIVTLRQFAPRATDCFDSEVRLNEKYMVLAQTGKSFQSLKSSSNQNAYADQIDVRGIWIDKLLAAKYLLMRSHNSRLFDKYTENYLHVQVVGAEIASTIEQVLMDKVQGPVEFQTIFGFPFTIDDYSYQLAEQHQIREPMVRQISKRLGLPGETTPFHHELLSAISSYVPSRIHNAAPFVSLFSAQQSLQNGSVASAYLHIKVGSEDFYADHNNFVAVEMITNLDLLSMKPEDLAVALKEFANSKGTDKDKPLGREMEAIIKYGPEKVESFLDDENIKSADYYISTLRKMTQL